VPRHALNVAIAERLIEAAGLLDQQGADKAPVKAYARAAETVADHGRDVAALGFDALAALLGEAVAAAVAEMARGGHWPFLDRLRGEADPPALFRTVPGMGAQAANRIHDELHIDTLTALEAAAADGRLASVRGLGPRRVATLRAGLDKRLDRVRGRTYPAAGAVLSEPTAEAILAIDVLYRAQTEAGRLPRLTPHRLNAEGRAWLPILHTRRGDWRFTALYTNSAQARGDGRTEDWVSILFYDGAQREGQRAVFTAVSGDLAGRRAIQGREAECRGFYAASGGGLQTKTAGPRSRRSRS
jgi:hypothetical protein